MSAPSDKDIRITFTLMGEEAQEFRRYLKRQNGRVGPTGRKLLLKGMKAEGLLPKWWRT